MDQNYHGTMPARVMMNKSNNTPVMDGFDSSFTRMKIELDQKLMNNKFVCVHVGHQSGKMPIQEKKFKKGHLIPTLLEMQEQNF